jgi:hypothetical protein
MSKKFKSAVSESIHESATALYAIGAISTATMREFEETCLAMDMDGAPVEHGPDTADYRAYTGRKSSPEESG